jgi:hypothetical protein
LSDSDDYDEEYENSIDDAASPAAAAVPIDALEI